MLHPNCPQFATPEAIEFGCRFSSEFHRLTHKRTLGEILLFRQMMKALTTAGNGRTLVRTAEYHGGKRQVRFAGPGGYCRTKARCELADVLAVTYCTKTQNVRMSYIQAKKERSVSFSSLTTQPYLKANLEQWHLLGARPNVQGVGRFAPPPTLLSSALLPSVGSFAFFMGAGRSSYDIFYASADVLKPRGANAQKAGGVYRQKQGTLQALDPAIRRTVYGPEAESMWGACCFGAALAGLMIGTPLLQGGKPVAAQTALWLAAELSAIRSRQESDSTHGLLDELIQMLGVSSDEHIEFVATGDIGAPTLLIMRGDVDPTENDYA